MTWHYNPATMKTDDQAEAPIRRVHVEEAIARLSSIGIRSRPLLVSIVASLSGLSKKEVAFNVEMVAGKEAL